MRRTSPLLIAALLLPVAAHAGFAASSHKKTSKSSGSNPYEIAAALDGNPATAWVTDPEQENKGQWVEIDVPRGKVDKISAVVGWAASDDQWVDHARLKTVRVQITSMAGGAPVVVFEKELTFEDKQERQVLDLPDTEVGDELEGGKVKLTVLETYPGKDYQNLAVGELLVHLVEFDAKTTKLGSASSEGEGHPGDHALDGNAKTWWTAGPSDQAPTLVLEAGRYSVSSLGLVPGPKTGARPKKIEVVQGETKRTYDVPDGAGPFWFELPALFGYTGSNFGAVTLTVTETWPGTSSTVVGIAEVKLKATALEAF